MTGKPQLFTGKSMVSGVDFPVKANPLSDATVLGDNCGNTKQLGVGYPPRGGVEDAAGYFKMAWRKNNGWIYDDIWISK